MFRNRSTVKCLITCVTCWWLSLKLLPDKLITSTWIKSLVTSPVWRRTQVKVNTYQPMKWLYFLSPWGWLDVQSRCFCCSSERPASPQRQMSHSLRSPPAGDTNCWLVCLCPPPHDVTKQGQRWAVKGRTEDRFKGLKLKELQDVMALKESKELIAAEASSMKRCEHIQSRTTEI